jgi:hypothetical protein
MKASEMDKFLAEIRDLVLKKLTDTGSQIPSGPAKQWLNEVIRPFVVQHMTEICLGAAADIEKAKEEQNWHSCAFHRPSASVYVSAFPMGTQQARVTYYADGYLRMIDGLRTDMKNKGFAENHFLHFQFFPEDWKTGLFGLSLTIYPNGKAGMPVAFVLPEELLSTDERNALFGNKEGAARQIAASKSRHWWQFWKA